MAKTNYKSKSFGKIFLAIIAIVCLALDAWFAYIHFFGEEKIVSTTATFSNMEVQRTEEATGEIVKEQKTFLEVNYYDNCIEIKFNQLYDEEQTAFYSYGIQLMIKDGIEKTLTNEDVFDGNYGKEIYSKLIEDDKEMYSSWLYFQKCKIFYDVYNKVLTGKNYTNLDLYEYQSFDDYETPLQSTFLQDGDEFFKLQVKDGENKKVYALKFKNYDTDAFKNLITTDLIKIGNQTDYKYTSNGFVKLNSYYDDITYYRATDIYYFIETIANSVKGLAPGFVGETYLKMPDVFNLFEYSEENDEYKHIGKYNDFTGKLGAENIIYSRIKLTVHEGDMTKSSQSIFNKFREYQNYDSNPDEVDMTDYLTGRNLITATLDDLTWESTNESGKYKFSLSNEFKVRWNEYKNTSFIKVVIDTEFLENNGLTYSGFDLDEDFFVYQIKTTQGDILYQGVDNV